MMFARTTRDNLVAIASAYAKAAGVSLTTVSKKTYGNADFFAGFRRGKQSISIDKVDSMLEWFRENWPQDADPPPFLPSPMMTVRKKKR